MTDISALNPIAYDASMEQLEPHEQEMISQLSDVLKQILETTSKDYGHAVRSVHAKSHALLQGELTVLDGLPPLLAQGMFATPGRHAAVMRFSTNPGDLLPDSISAPRGLGIKVLGVNGERVAGAEGRSTQDFVLADAPVFGAPDAKHFLGILKLLARTTDRLEGLKKVISALLRLIEGVIEATGAQSGTIAALGGRTLTHPLADVYYSATPFLYGRNIVKFSLAPISANLLALKGKKIDLNGRRNALREEIAGTMMAGSATWELRAQFCIDLKKMPVENPTVLWDEKLSPFIAVARVSVPSQPSWTDERSRRVDDGLAFDVWHALAAHRPLGSINRVRKPLYSMSAEFRARFNGCSVAEPATIALPD